MQQGKFARTVLAALGGLLVAAAALAAPVAVYGPERFDKPKGGPVEYRRIFNAPDPAGQYRLRVESGADGLQEVKNVTVRLNGMEVVDSAALRAGNPVERPIAVQGENTLEVALKGQGGNFVSVTVECEGCRTLRIVEPAPRAMVSERTFVHGEVLQAPGTEVSVTVNGVPALVDGGRFVANHVPVPLGAAEIVIRAQLPGGIVAEERVPVYAVSMVWAATLSSDRSSGIAPLQVALTLTQFASSSSPPLPPVTCSGPATPTLSGSGSSYSVLLPEPGLYLCRTELGPLPHPGSFSDTLGILVYDKAALDNLLQAKWGGMKAALMAGDVIAAANFFSEHTRATYLKQFEQMPGLLSRASEEMGNITLLNLADDAALYDLRTVRNGKTYSFQLEFTRDGDGLWRIDRF